MFLGLLLRISSFWVYMYNLLGLGAFEFAGCLKNGLRQNRLLSFKAVLSDHDIRVFRRRCLFLVPFLFIFRFLVVVS